MKFLLSKKNFLFAVGFLIISIFFLFPLFHGGIPKTHDGEGHIVRIAAYQKALQSGQFPVRWASDLNYSFGSPLFIFYYPLPYYLGVLIHFAGINLEVVFKLLLSIVFIGSFVSFYTWVRLFSEKKIAFLGSLLYLLNPYHFLDLYVRGDIGELFAYALLPLVFYFVEKNSKKISTTNILLGSIILSLVMLSHNGISLMFLPILCFYVLCKSYKNSKKVFISNILLVMLGLSISAFFWIPALYDKKFIITLAIFDNFYKNNFTSIKNIIYSPWNFGPDILKPGGLSSQIGIVALCILAFSFFIALKRKSKLIFFWLIVSFLGIFLALPYSNFLYEHIKLLRDFQFPWRFLVLVSFSSSVLFVLLFKNLSTKIIVLLTIILLVYSYSFVKVQGFVHYPDSYYFSSQDITFYHGEAIPIWTEGNMIHFPKASLELIAGQGQVTNYKKIGTSHSFTVNGFTQTGFLDNTIFFPGWQVKVDGARIPIQFQDAHHRGLITFDVPKGKHMVTVEYRETGITIFSDIISFVTLIAVLGWLGIVLAKKYVG